MTSTIAFSSVHSGWPAGIPRIAPHEDERSEESGATLAASATFQMHRIEQPHWSVPSSITAIPDARPTLLLIIGLYSSCVNSDMYDDEGLCWLFLVRCTISQLNLLSKAGDAPRAGCEQCLGPPRSPMVADRHR